MNELEIRLAAPDELAQAMDLYHAVIDALTPEQPGPRWTKGVYPTVDDVREAIEARTLYLAFAEGKLAGAMVLNQVDDPVYEQHPFPSGIAQSDCTVVHLLAISPAFRGRHFGSKMMEFAQQQTRALGARAIRLDVIEGNLPAFAFYEAFGFVNAGNVTMFYEDTGWVECTLYELVV